VEGKNGAGDPQADAATANSQPACRAVQKFYTAHLKPILTIHRRADLQRSAMMPGKRHDGYKPSDYATP